MSEKFIPESEQELAQILRSARGNRASLRIISGGTRQALGKPVHAKNQLHLHKLSGITLYEPAALTLVVKAGTPLAEVNAALAAENQHLPFEPADYRALLGSHGEPSIGGVVACGISGPRRIQAGACRDSLIGVRFVDGSGEIIKNGGRVMKNVTGYDLVKLLCGSHGSLGVLSEVSFKLLPRPQTTGMVTIASLSDPDAVRAMSAALGSPFDVTGAAHLQRGPDGRAQTAIRIEGFEASVKYRLNQLQNLLSAFGEVETSLDDKINRSKWEEIRDVKVFAGQKGAVWKLSLKPGDAPKAVLALQQQIPLQAAYDWGGGLVWLLVDEENDASANLIRAAVDHVGGHAKLVRASDATRNMAGVFHPQNAVIAAISALIRAQYDPAGILNPEIMTSAIKT